MARGIAFSELVLQLRAELRRSQSPAVGNEDIPSLRQTINHVIQTVSNARDWPFMYRKFPPLTLNAGQRYYDLPTGLIVERVTGTRIRWGGSYYLMKRGISYDDYLSWDPELDQRSSPALKWDIQNIAGAEQIEIWPIPDIGQSLYFEGQCSHPRLVADTDLCQFDDTIVVLFAAAELTLDSNAKESQAKRDQGNEIMRQISVRSARGDQAPVQIGLGAYGNDKLDSGRAVVRISGA